MATFDTWGGSWGESWGISWTREESEQSYGGRIPRAVNRRRRRDQDEKDMLAILKALAPFLASGGGNG